MPRAPKPTERELQILQVLWRNGPSTVREVRDELMKEGKGALGYTTVLTLMQIMAEKGLLVRDESARAHVYTAAMKTSEVENTILSDVIDRLFNGSALSLAARAVELKLSPKDRKRLLELLEELEK